MIASRVCSSRSPTAQAFVAITTRSAVTHAARRVQHGRRAAVEARDARALVDAHAELQRDAAQTAHEQRRLQDRGRGLEEARDVAIGAAAPRRLLGRPLLEGHHAELAAGRHDAVPGAELGLRRRRPEVAATVVVRVDPVLARRTRRSRPRPPRGTRELERAVAAAELDERAQLGPPREREAAVAPARAAAADVLLEHDDIARGLALLDADGRPEAGVAAAHDGDVGARRAFEREGCGLAAARAPRRARASDAAWAGDASQLAIEFLMLASTLAVASVTPFLAAWSK